MPSRTICRLRKASRGCPNRLLFFSCQIKNYAYVQIALYIPPCLPIEYQRFRILKELFRSLFVLEVQVKMMFFNHKHLTSNDHRKMANTGLNLLTFWENEIIISLFSSFHDFYVRINRISKKTPWLIYP